MYSVLSPPLSEDAHACLLSPKQGFPLISSPMPEDLVHMVGLQLVFALNLCFAIKFNKFLHGNYVEQNRLGLNLILHSKRSSLV